MLSELVRSDVQESYKILKLWNLIIFYKDNFFIVKKQQIRFLLTMDQKKQKI